MQKAALPLALTQNVCDAKINQGFCEDFKDSSVHEVSDLLQNKIDLSLLVITKHPRHAFNIFSFEIWTRTAEKIIHVCWLSAGQYASAGHLAKVPMRRTMQQSRLMWSWPSACGSFALRDVTLLVQEETLAILHSGYDCYECFMFSSGCALCLSI